MDVIALHQAGFSNAVATLGTALTPEQARLMARYTKSSGLLRFRRAGQGGDSAVDCHSAQRGCS